MNEQRNVAGAIEVRESTLTLEEFAVACGAEVAWVVEIVEAGLVAPRQGAREAWRFDSPDLARARRAWSLRRDFDADLELAGLVLDLVDEVERLRLRLRRAGFDSG